MSIYEYEAIKKGLVTAKTLLEAYKVGLMSFQEYTRRKKYLTN